MNDVPQSVTNMQESFSAYEDQVKRWRRLWVVTYVALVAVLLSGIFTYFEIRENNAKRDQQIKDLAHVVEITESVTGPEAEEATQRLIESLVQQIDCNQRQSFQDALDYLVVKGILDEAIPIVGEDCVN
jgi:Na+-transporting NADH:ubiquinone oxidoreductase subunit NqrC